MVGRATTEKLHRLNIFTIGDLANYDANILREKMKSHGILIRNYANGIEDSTVRKSNYIEMKGVDNSTTIPFDVEDRETAHKVLLSLCETIGMRLRDSHNSCRVISVSIRGSDLISYSHQKKLDVATDSTRKIAEVVCSLFDKVWKGNKIRHLGGHVTELGPNDFYQSYLLDDFNYEKDRAINDTIDKIRLKYGSGSIMRSCFLQSGLSAMCGGVGEEDYPMMSSML